MARTIQPFHTEADGDILYLATTNEVANDELNAVSLGVLASEVDWCVNEVLREGQDLILCANRRGASTRLRRGSRGAFDDRRPVRMRSGYKSKPSSAGMRPVCAKTDSSRSATEVFPTEPMAPLSSS